MPMMCLAVLPLAMTYGLAACSEPAPAPQAVEAPIVMKVGQWALTRRTTGYNTATVTPAEYQAALKQVTQDKVCIAVDAKGIPDANAIAGADGTDCSYKDVMVRKGRLIATLSCKAGTGTAEIVTEGNYTADTLTLGTTMTRTQGGGPVLRTTHDLTGTHVGKCPTT